MTLTTNPFEYQAPTATQAAEMQAVNEHFKAAYERIAANVRPSAERTLAIRKLQECRMWTNVAILGIELPR